VAAHAGTWETDSAPNTRTVADIEACARDQNISFRPGDVLVIRTGMTEILSSPQPADFAKMQNAQLAGVDGCLESAKWLWNQHFSAVAGDSIAFEALMPIKEEGSVGTPVDLGEFYVRLIQRLDKV
jgi:hypothetical protein